MMSSTSTTSDGRKTPMAARKIPVWTLVALLPVLVAGVGIVASRQYLAAVAQAEDAKLAAEGWTGLTQPLEIVDARYQLMLEMEDLMIPLDSFTAGDAYDVNMLRANAEGVSKLLKVVPHLFPPTTNLYRPEDMPPVTLAQADLWQNFDSFYSLAMDASKTAEEASTTADPDAFRQKALDIRTACAACHDSFLLTYQAPAVSTSDEDFDFGEFN